MKFTFVYNIWYVFLCEPYDNVSTVHSQSWIFERKENGYRDESCLPDISAREEVFMEGPIQPNMGPSLADVLLCTLESTNAGFSSFPVRKLLS